MTAISGSAAAVTGAASGIGRALALELSARGCDLALADRDEAGLLEVAAEMGRNSGRRVSTHRVDIGEPAQIQDFAKAAIAAHPGLNIVINNAGVALLGGFNEVDQAQMERLLRINLWGGPRHARLPAASFAAARGAYRQLVLDLRHHRPARPDRLLRGEIRGARLLRKHAA